MRSFYSFLMTIIGVLIFIYLLPTLLWLLFILIAVVLCYVYVQKRKFQKYTDAYQEDAYASQEEYTRQTNTKMPPSSDDIIDVEYSESEDKS